MRIVVCIKFVPDTAIKVKVAPDKKWVDLSDVAFVVKLEIADGRLRAEREIEGARETIEATLPAVVTAQKGLNTPRYASLRGIMAAKKKEIQVRTLESLGISGSELEPRLVVEEVFLPPPRSPGKILRGEASEAVPQLVKLLHEEAKV